MRVVNVHQRTIQEPKNCVSKLLETLATPEDKIWPNEAWPPMRLKDGLVVGSKGGHGPIRYSVEAYEKGTLIQFAFSRPAGFHGHHRLEVNSLNENTTELKHTIEMEAKGTAVLSWALGIRWLHDALIEDAFDKVEGQFTGKHHKTSWNIWVRVLRAVLARKPRSDK